MLTSIFSAQEKKVKEKKVEKMPMTILFYRYGSICEPDIINTFRSMQLHVAEENTEITHKHLSPSDSISLIRAAVERVHPVFVFSVNFFPLVAEVCHIYKIPYLCWTVDSPLPELFSRSVQYDTNRLFLFDRAQYDTFSPYNPSRIFYLPLASAVERFDQTLSGITAEDVCKYSGDITFVGSLYTEKNPLRSLAAQLPKYTQGYLSGVVDASLKVYGGNFMEELLSESLIKQLKQADPSFYSAGEQVCNSDRYIAAHFYLGMAAAEAERVKTLNLLAEHFQVDLYTRSDTSALQKVHIKGGVKTLTEMPKVFRLSKINLNMTIKPIQTGLPLRIFDILGCGGFVMTNYQAELTDYFEIGTDLEAYSSTEELVDKCAYYLSHEEERARIAQNGYQKAAALHTYRQRLLAMLQLATESGTKFP